MLIFFINDDMEGEISLQISHGTKLFQNSKYLTLNYLPPRGH
jgi:hypothetical protein